MALLGGLVLGGLGSRAWWPVLNVSSSSGRALLWVLRSIRIAIRALATLARSVHELLWALLFITAVGTSPLAAVLAGQRGPLKPLVSLAFAPIQLLAWGLDRIHRVESAAWNFLLVARRA